jgi:serine/threonine protein kinase
VNVIKDQQQSEANVPEIPGYRILGQLGVGGMATVYLANQESFDREVALKVMAPALAADANYGDRFMREARIAARFSHPNIIAVYDVGVHKDHYYIAMEHHSGGDLKGRLRKGMTTKQAMSILRQMAAALDYAHSKGYIHRDVKPDNILFREDGSAVLTDFGIARPAAGDTQMTQIGMVVGTPKYMSPEQARGQELDARSDIYSLGIVFYEIMVGRVPFDGRDSIDIGIKHDAGQASRRPLRPRQGPDYRPRPIAYGSPA